MKDAWKALVVVTCIAGMVALRINDADGWGWLIVIAILAVLS